MAFKKKPSCLFSIFNIFKCRSAGDGGYSSGDEGLYMRRVRYYDDGDKLGWVWEPDIDRKASDFITKFRNNIQA
uniref:Uncharacterized protein n=1 Tax=Nelumbo nucifera TaxID=4432 RepID=A0A822YWJ9_NELNU|nr:TPA_asm: hypothetical protein HUJ06_009115 [Nelumbo nucifera]